MIQSLDFAAHAVAVQHAERFRDFLRKSSDRRGFFPQLPQGEQRPKKPTRRRFEPEVDAGGHRLFGRFRKFRSSQNNCLRRQNIFPACNPRDRIAEPSDQAIVGEDDRLVDRLNQPIGPRLQFQPQGLPTRWIRSSSIRVGADDLDAADI
ncbi:MAG TPA: hypothetical protein VMS87_04785 [Roseiarcus sp.]|nr:hypothetical protein [Roseiarcus sp.]